VTGAELKQRLMAILAADAAGYSRLMAADEHATVEALEAARKVFASQIGTRQGRVIDMAGDSVLAVFETATGAVTAALAIQGELEAAAGGVAENRRMRFRMGIHLGDVIEKADGTVFGDGVNVAARLQALAEPGGVLVSDIVQQAVRDRMSAGFEDRGEHAVKNIARPVHVYRVAAEAPATQTASNATKTVTQAGRRRNWQFVALGFLLSVLASGVWIATGTSAGDLREWILSALGRRATQASAAPATIAVMPFANQSGDAKRDYLSDGVTEDIISALGRFSGIRVMSKNAVQGFKGKAPTSQEIRDELGARYVVQGSVREAAGKLRVAVELSDTDKGVLLWSERYDGDGAQIFEIQDRIVKNLVGALAVKLTRIEEQRVFTRPTDSLEAHDLVLRARSLLDRGERGANREARTLLARAEKLSPEYAEIMTSLCDAELQRALHGWIEDAVEGMRRAEQFCKRALASPDQRAHTRAHALLASIYSNQNRLEEALHHSERAIELNASDSAALYRRGAALLYAGRIEEAIAAMETAKRFEPHPSSGEAYNLAIAYYVAGRYRDALTQAEAALARSPSLVGVIAVRVAALAQLGNADEARQAADQVRRLSPDFKTENYGTRFADPKYTASLQAGLRKAGL
jgi:TolB-like protein/class 3 adenylate cyclase/Tfp pilus assembly protein PilF